MSIYNLYLSLQSTLTAVSAVTTPPAGLIQVQCANALPDLKGNSASKRFVSVNRILAKTTARAKQIPPTLMDSGA